MRIAENIRIGFEGIAAHKLRSVLTMLGIIFGVGAVVAMFSIGEGAKQEALKQIEMMGVNNIIIQDAGLEGEELIEARAAFSSGLTLADARAIESMIPAVFAAIPLRKDDAKVIFGRAEMKVNLIGVTEEYAEAHNIILGDGYFPDETDAAENRRVCAIGSGIKRKLFPFVAAVGEDIKIDGKWFTVVGEMADKNVTIKNLGGYQVRDFNEDIAVPVTTVQKYFDRAELKSPLNQLIVRVNPDTDIRAVSDVINRMLKRRHHEQRDFKVIIPEELLRQSQSTQRIFNIVMGAIAGISLLVGGIGIMNIMLSSVLERTREIGVRMAIGAKKNEILGQFLTEAVTLSFSGGIIGIILGVILAKVITYYAGWVTIVSVVSVLLAFGVATIVGLVFGIYPAKRAANLHPIDALRYE